MYESQRDSRGAAAPLRRRAGAPARPARGAPRRAAHDARRGAGAGSGGAAGPARREAMTATAPAFPAALTDSRAFAIARAMLDGFDRHYRLFRQASAEAKARFEAADWHGQQQAQAQRIAYYERRVAEATERLQSEFQAATLPMEVWQQVKLHYIGLLINHYQPELAETFFNSVTTKILHRSYFHNDFIFVRSAVSTDHLENDEPAALPTYRAYYPTRETLVETWHRVVTNFQLDARVRGPRPRRRRPDGGGRRAARRVPPAHQLPDPGAVVAVLPQQGRLHRRQDHQRLQPRRRSRCRSCTAAKGLVIDAALFGEDDLELVFSFARAYFMVTMEVPSAYVQFLRSLMPRKPRSEIYSALGLQKQGKSLFYRDLLMHMRHSSDKFRIAPGIKGMVMLVFDLPSFPYVFKVIKDFYPPPKDTTRELIKSKYLLVKQHDRVGRMADTLEYSDVAFPRARFDDELVAELRHFCASLVEEEGDDARHPPLLHRAAHDPAQHLPAGRDAPSRSPRSVDRVRQRDQGPGARQHLPRRHAVEELRRHPPRPGRLLRLRRDRIPHRLHLSQGARGAQRGRRDVGRGLVPGRPEGRLSRDLRAVPARQPGGPRDLHGRACRPARPGILARPQAGNPGRLRA